MFYTKRRKRKHSNRSALPAQAGEAQPLYSVEPLEKRELLSGVNWGAVPRQIGLDKAVQNFPQYNGDGESIAIIDTGVDYRHPVLGGSFGPNNIVDAGYNFINKNGDPFPFDNAHGTGSAAIAGSDPFDYDGLHYQGISTGANLIALRENSTAGTKASLDWVIANQAKYNIVAVNMIDWGGGDGRTYAAELSALYKAGVFVGSPAGNGGAAHPAGRPAGSHVVLTGSVDSSDQISTFTQRGPALSILAPGEEITLPYYDVVTKKHVILPNTFGTSWSSPMVVGAAALIKQVNPAFTPDQILSIMQDSGVAVADPASGLTYKRLDVNAALSLAVQRATPTPAPTPPPNPAPDPDPTDPRRTKRRTRGHATVPPTPPVTKHTAVPKKKHS